MYEISDVVSCKIYGTNLFLFKLLFEIVQTSIKSCKLIDLLLVFVRYVNLGILKKANLSNDNGYNCLISNLRENIRNLITMDKASSLFKLKTHLSDTPWLSNLIFHQYTSRWYMALPPEMIKIWAPTRWFIIYTSTIFLVKVYMVHYNPGHQLSLSYQDNLIESTYNKISCHFPR